LESESSTKDLSFPIFGLFIRQLRLPHLRSRAQMLCHSMVWVRGATCAIVKGQRPNTAHKPKKPRPIVTHVNTRKARYYRLISMDSGLEAFSLNPTRGSFGALTLQSTPLPITRTNGSSRTKLDYCRDNDFISRVKLTCLTTV